MPYSGCRYLRNAIQKYGWDNFKVEFRQVPVETLNEEEQKQIKRLNTMAPNGYNLTSGGERYKASEETKKRMSAAAKKAGADPAVYARRSAAQKKALADPAVKARRSAAQKKKWEDPAVKARWSAAIKKAHADPAVKAKMSAAMNKANADPAVKKRKSAAAKKRCADPAWRAKIMKKIVVTSLLTNKATTYASVKEAVKETGFGHPTITRCCKARQVATGEYSMRYENESDELKKKHENMLKVLTNTPCVVQEESGRKLRSFCSAVEAVRWLRDEKQLKPNFLTAYKALTGKSKGGYGTTGGLRITAPARSHNLWISHEIHNTQ
jgi:group I intron endonuclease